MMGRTHAVTGLLAGLAVAPSLGIVALADRVLFAIITAGYALLPDLDHEESSASQLLAWVTNPLSDLVRAGSAGLYRVTKGPRDEACAGMHRHMTHTLAFAALTGYLAGWGGGQSIWAVGGIAMAGILLAEDRLGDWVLPVALVAGFTWWLSASDDMAGALNGVSWKVGFAVALGCVVHSLGDACTLSGCPLLFPIPIAGETWYEIELLGPLGFRTGGKVERWFVFPAAAATSVLLIPGVWPIVWPPIAELLHRLPAA